jgi:vancomycin resistance protein YoaR
MPERQSSPGEAAAPPEPDITESARSAGATEQAASGDAQPLPPVRAGERAGSGNNGNGQHNGQNHHNGQHDNGRPAAGAPRPTPRPAPGPAPAGPQPQGDESPTVRTTAGRGPANRPGGEHPNGRPAGGESPTVRAAAAGRSAPGPRPSPEPHPFTGPRPQTGEQRSTEATTVGVQAATPQAATPQAATTQAATTQAGADGASTQMLPRAQGQTPPPSDEPVTERLPALAPRPPEPLVAEPTRIDPVDTGDSGGRRPGRGRRRVLLVAAAVGAFGLLYGADLLLSSGSMPRGVTVAGVGVGTMSLADAEERLRSEIGARIGGPIPVTVGDARGEIDPTAAGLSVDWAGTVDRAAEQPLNPITRISSFFSGREVGVVTIADPTALGQALEQLGPVVDSEPVEGSVRFDGTDPQPVDPKPGQRLDVAAAGDVLQRDWANGGVVALPITELPPTTTAEDVEAAIQEVARPAVAAPITVNGENGVQGDVTPDVIAASLSFVAENGGLSPELNQQLIQDALTPQMADSEKPGRDATFDFSGGRAVVVPSQDGRGVDYEATVAALVGVLSSPQPREVTAVYAEKPAEVTTEELQALGNPEIIGEFTTGGFAPDSGRNIKRAAELVNGTVVQPGEVFSLDAVTGPRTAANGYVEAGVIDNGRSARGIAGGASQVSTTLYNAAYFAGMTLLEHKAHSFYISRYPAGREATIATGAIDNKFRNDNPSPIMIRTRWTPSSVTVQIYGQRKYEVTGEFGPRTNPTQPNEVTIPSGEDCHASNGAPGFTITDTRTRRDVDTGEVKKETITTRYNPAPKVVCED